MGCLLRVVLRGVFCVLCYACCVLHVARALGVMLVVCCVLSVVCCMLCVAYSVLCVVCCVKRVVTMCIMRFAACCSVYCALCRLACVRCLLHFVSLCVVWRVSGVLSCMLSGVACHVLRV